MMPPKHKSKLQTDNTFPRGPHTRLKYTLVRNHIFTKSRTQDNHSGLPPAFQNTGLPLRKLGGLLITEIQTVGNFKMPFLPRWLWHTIGICSQSVGGTFHSVLFNWLGQVTSCKAETDPPPTLSLLQVTLVWVLIYLCFKKGYGFAVVF